MTYLAFRELAVKPDRKTKIVWVLSVSSEDKLGEIRWFGRWRQYTFWPEPGTIYNPDCMREIAEHCAAMTSAHRAKAKS